MCTSCNSSQNNIENEIADHGWAVCAGTYSCGHAPDYAYSAGLTESGLPELLVHGLPTLLAAELIDEVADAMMVGARVASGTVIGSSLAAGPLLAVVDVIDTSDLEIVHTLYPRFRAVQLVWPDSAGTFPWEPGYSLCAWHQPLTGVGWTRT